MSVLEEAYRRLVRAWTSSSSKTRPLAFLDWGCSVEDPMLIVRVGRVI